MKHFLFLHEFYTSCAMIKLIIYQNQKSYRTNTDNLLVF